MYIKMQIIKRLLRMKLKDLIKYILEQNPLIILLGMGTYLLLIALGDFLLVGGVLAKNNAFSASEIVSFYFGRSLAEHLMLLLGIMLGYKFCEDMKKEVKC